MDVSFAPRNLLLPFAAAAAFGALAATQSKLAIGLTGVALVGALALLAPVANLILLIVFTLIIPLSLQQQLSVGGGTDAPGLLPADLFLVAGLVGATLALARQRLDRRQLLVAGLLVLFLAVAVLQFVHGLSAGREPSKVGDELRVLLGFGAFFLALPLLADPRSRSRLFVGLLGVALALGLWGIVQWVVQFDFAEASDFGVREGVRLTTGGRGQVIGGYYGFPAAVIACYAVLLSGTVRSLFGRVLVGAALALNAVSLVLTFERTFWIVSVLGCVFVTLKATNVQKAKALLIVPISVLVSLAVLAAFAPREVTTARERLLSLGLYRSDDSLRYRVVESRHVIEEIRERPISGSGLGASIYWGRPWQGIGPQSYEYSHNGYLWLSWKVGIPAAALLVLLFLAAVAWQRGPPVGTLARALRNGAQAALLALLVGTVTFPSVNTRSVTSAMGLLLALAALPALARNGRARGRFG